jgi:Tn3 transposase DDE domain
MIEGVLRHCTAMEVDRQYVDSHGQSAVAFAFCHLLGFQLLPRLKAIHQQGVPGAIAGKCTVRGITDWRIVSSAVKTAA